MKIKHCPFCRSGAKLHEHGKIGGGYYTAHVACSICDEVVQYGDGKTIEEAANQAIDRWNARYD